jgi:hypothetical protein
MTKLIATSLGMFDGIKLGALSATTRKIRAISVPHQSGFH